MLIMIFKIKHDLAPPYLVELLPETTFQCTNRKLRSHTKIAPIGNKYIRLELFRKSFFAIAIEKWNKLPSTTRQITKLESFKKAITKDLKKCNILYFYGKRWPSVHHARIRIGCSKLKSDLYLNLHVINNQICTCGYRKEDAKHFFMHCPLYNDIRLDLYNAIYVYSPVTLNIILYGNPRLEQSINKFIFDAVHLFILRSRRFL